MFSGGRCVCWVVYAGVSLGEWHHTQHWSFLSVSGARMDGCQHPIRLLCPVWLGLHFVVCQRPEQPDCGSIAASPLASYLCLHGWVLGMECAVAYCT
jgi:hypothetical protein